MKRVTPMEPVNIQWHLRELQVLAQPLYPVQLALRLVEQALLVLLLP
jgi:hypothetical protein